MSQPRVNVMIDSAEIATVAATLLYLSDQHPLNIIVSGTLDEVTAKQAEITKLLTNSRFQPTFTFGVGGDLRGASLAFIAGAAREGYAFKLLDYGYRARLAAK